MKKILFILTLLLSINAYSQDDVKSKLDGLYLGLGTGFVVGDELDFNIKNTINLLVGYNVNQYLAFEGEVNQA